VLEEQPANNTTQHNTNHPIIAPLRRRGIPLALGYLN
jgi:hypothetical protein